MDMEQFKKMAKVDVDAFVAELMAKAREAGNKAAEEAKPTPIIVGEAKSILSNEIDHSKPTYYVPGGICGFAYAKFSAGQRKLFNSFKRLNGVNTRGGTSYDPYGRADTYEGGWDISPAGMAKDNQSLEIKEAYCRAFAEVFRKEGFDVYMQSRVD